MAAMPIQRPTTLRIAFVGVAAIYRAGPSPLAREALMVLYVYNDAIDIAPATTPTMLMGTRFQ